MDKEQFDQITGKIKSRKAGEIKKLKKEDLIDYIKSFDDVYKDKLDEIKKESEDLENRKKSQELQEEIEKELDKNLEEYKSLISEYQDLLDQKNQELERINKTCLDLDDLSKTRLFSMYAFMGISAVLLIIIAAILF